MHLITVYVLCTLVMNNFHDSMAESVRIPSSDETCNVVNLNFGKDTPENFHSVKTKGDPGPPGKKGPAGSLGSPGRKGEKGERGPIGESESKINMTEIKLEILKSLAATSCEDLKENHGVAVSGHYMIKDTNSMHPKYVYCDFELRQGVSTCRDVGKNFGVDKVGYYLLKPDDSSDPTFVYCKTFNNDIQDCETASHDNVKTTETKGGVFTVFLNGHDGESVEVYCDLTTDGGGWTVFQRRIDGSVNFYRNWEDYVRGFGEKEKEMWLGLENIYQLTKEGKYELRIEFTNWEGKSYFAKYSTFSIASAADKYKLKVGGFSGNATDSMTYHNEMQFSTKDADNDPHSSHCALTNHRGAWWYKSCAYANLNGMYYKNGAYKGSHYGIFWASLKRNWNYSMKSTEMKFRKIS